MHCILTIPVSASVFAGDVESNAIPHIIVDQFGYRPGDDKVAVIANPHIGFNASEEFNPGSEYQVRRVSHGATVYSGGIAPWNNGKIDMLSGDKVWWFDFSPLGTPGEYYIFDVQKKAKSYPFKIGDDVYKDVLYAALRMFYYQREAISHTACSLAARILIINPG